MMSPEENRNELYFSENDAGSRPWWDVPSYLNGPIRFGTFDGVFVSVFFLTFLSMFFFDNLKPGLTH